MKNLTNRTVKLLIDKIDIKSYGAFRDFVWTKNVDSSFTQLNLIYGRNYSGKTTFSRIFGSIQKKQPHPDFSQGQFVVHLSDRSSFNENQLSDDRLRLRVYNSDFKIENLSFFTDREGHITPFAILGEHNVEVEKQIAYERNVMTTVRRKLDGDTEFQGLRESYMSIDKELQKLEKELSDKLREKARNIKRDASLFDFKEFGDYTIATIKNEIDEAASTVESSHEELTKLRTLQSEPVKNALRQVSLSNLELSHYIEKTNQLVSKVITPSQSIELLLTNPELQKWVQEGMHYHKEKHLERCAFCNAELSSSLWERLDAHFTQETELHQEQLSNLINAIRLHASSIETFDIPDFDDFYIEYQDQYRETLRSFNDLQKRYLGDLEFLIDQLNRKSLSLYQQLHIDGQELSATDSLLSEVVQEINALIEANNDYNGNISNRKNEATRQLRLSEVKKFIGDINYNGEIEHIAQKKQELAETKLEVENLERSLQEHESKIEKLQMLLRNERIAAQAVNEYLSFSFTHENLHLHVQEDNTFLIKRGDEPAYNLSEGEQTLISFSYFLATLKDIPVEEREDYLIFIDDPISSLDSSNIFQIFSLVDTEIISGDYKQIFISTHNMDFLTYLLHHGGKRKKGFYLIERENVADGDLSVSRMVDMPKYMRNYTTEFVYLFDQIYQVANDAPNDKNYHVFYNFPNNARKFLESYLFFKYPDTKIKHEERLKRFFGEGLQQVAFIQRINNEFSHGEKQFDRLYHPVDVPEFQKDALMILEAVKRKDSEQYESFCKSIEI